MLLKLEIRVSLMGPLAYMQTSPFISCALLWHCRDLHRYCIPLTNPCTICGPELVAVILLMPYWSAGDTVESSVIIIIIIIIIITNLQWHFHEVALHPLFPDRIGI